ncbi:pyrroloquinoline quinone biosynthesis protein PqqE [Microbulbifer echini]|uniref:PqqA peptide cyclase n=1 Tax=Microbulbifer echini TaxID=1529067 RepID=A0ABV4NIM7_9GAMM
MENNINILPPIAMLAELTHRCPLACPYCSNPMELIQKNRELNTSTWLDVFRQAAAMGVLQVHLSGGEPASRQDLAELVAGARQAGLYVNLITSGIGLNRERLIALDVAGVDHIQLSLQGVNSQVSDWVSGYQGSFQHKLSIAGDIREIGIPLTVNAVMHRHNLDDLEETLQMAYRLGARRVEVACVQFQGWALRNRAILQPTRDQVDRAKRILAGAIERFRGEMVIDFVPPDYYADFPKACMGGWGSTGLNVTPDGTLLPCHGANIIPGMEFDNVRQTRLADSWYRGLAFNAFRGGDWLPELCKNCDRKNIDFGGCRCQAMAIAGDASAADPVCKKSPHRKKVDLLLEAEAKCEPAQTFRYRRIRTKNLCD